MVQFTPDELSILRELRERFLAGTAGAADYWQSPEHLELYDSTYAERIGWKWDAVLDELDLRGWQPQSTRVLDWWLWHRRGPPARAHEVAAIRHRQLARSLATRAPVCRAKDAAGISASVRGVGSSDRHAGHAAARQPRHQRIAGGRADSLLELARAAGEVIWVEPGRTRTAGA